MRSRERARGLVLALMTVAGCAGAEPTPRTGIPSAASACLADDMPADLVAGSPRWTAADQACRDDPGACVSRCDQGDGGACYALGVGLQDHGREAEAESRFEQACRAGSAIGCTNYGAGLLPDSVSEDAEEAVCAARIFERTCAAGERLWGCGMWGFVLVRGQGVQPDPAQALTVLERSCAETEYFACDVLGLAHRQGLFGPPSIDAARQAYARGCRGGYASSCEALTTLDSTRPTGN